jgi:microcystin-dependent protein
MGFAGAAQSDEGVTMATPYLGEIRYVGFSFAPQGWALCNGQLLPISEFDALFALLGTTFGGDGENTFQLPNLQSRVAVHQGTSFQGTSYVIGGTGGAENVTLPAQDMPQHSHAIQAVTANGNSSSPSGSVFAAESQGNYVAVASATGIMAPAMVGVAGQGLPHSNLQPYLAVTCIIALEGIFPSQD